MQDLVRLNESDEWQEGTLGELHMVTSESLVVGARATRVRTFGIDMLLYYRTRENLVQELTYNLVHKSWQVGFLFSTSNDNSGIELSYADKAPSIRQIIFLNQAYQLEVWWKDFNESAVASPAHPVGVWTRGM